jgi:hypothetical protein
MDPAIENEKRFLTNIRVAGEYISKEWMVETTATAAENGTATGDMITPD